MLLMVPFPSVNNVGVGNTYPEYFGSIPVDESEKMMNVNILSVIKVGICFTFHWATVNLKASWKFAQYFLHPCILAMKNFKPHVIFTRKFQTPDRTKFYWNE